MPELPEVETIRRDLNAVLTGRKIASINILSPKTAFPDAVFFDDLRGRKIKEIKRRGKLLIFALSPNESFNYLLIHLKMTGQLVYSNGRTKISGGHDDRTGRHGHKINEPADIARLEDGRRRRRSINGEFPSRHTRAIIRFSNGGQLFFNDLRRFGYLKLATAEDLERTLKNYGPEPLTPDFSFSFLEDALKNRKTKIKVLLLNQKIIAGLGNIYVDESLWLARVNPERLAGSLRPAEIKKLHSAINKVIKSAIKYRGTTFSDYLDSRGRKGNFSRFLKVYGRRGEKCPNCRGLISKIKIAGRGTHYCPHCQK